MLGPRDRMIGQLFIEGDLRVGGIVEGEVEATGDVEIDDMAKVKASLAGRDVTIRGQVNGAVVARKRLVVARSGSLYGDVRVARLAIQDGATFSGNVSMGAAAEAPAKIAEARPVVAEPKVEELPAPTVISPPALAPAVASRGDGKAAGKGKPSPPPKAKPKKGR
jgi:cytoskeletal protein CcmA (bactofilin family)